MSNVTDAKLVIETILGRTMTDEALIRVADAYWEADPHSSIWTQEFDQAGDPLPVPQGKILPADPDNPTNDEKAKLFLLTLKKNGQAVVGSVSDRASDDSAAAAKAAARAAAEADMT
jgi:hypothetical protein